MVRSVAQRDRAIRAGVRPSIREAEVVIYYDVLRQAGADNLIDLSLPGDPTILVEPPEGRSQRFSLAETVAGHYEARIPVSEPGLYRIASGGAELELPELGYYRESAEARLQAVNMPLLREISRLTGGKLQPAREDLLYAGGGTVPERKPLWPYLLTLALVLNFVELALRKGFFEYISSWAQRRSATRWRRQPV
jgi:hypothetical protein